MTTLSPIPIPIPIPVYLLRLTNSVDDYGHKHYRYEAGYFNAESGQVQTEEITVDAWRDAWLTHDEHIIYYEGADYASFDAIAAENDACHRYAIARQQAMDDAYEDDKLMEAHYASEQLGVGR